MKAISIDLVKPDDTNTISLIAGWYLQEWNITREVTIQKLSDLSTTGLPLQVIMTIDGLPVATGGLYTHVGLLDIAPRYKAYGPWLALVFTRKELRNQGYGALLCEQIQQISKELGLKEIFLFTHTAETLYRRLGWQPMERLHLKDKAVVVMKKALQVTRKQAGNP